MHVRIRAYKHTYACIYVRTYVYTYAIPLLRFGLKGIVHVVLQFSCNSLPILCYTVMSYQHSWDI